MKTQDPVNHIRFYATSWCPDCLRAKTILIKTKAPYKLIDIDQDPEGLEFVKEVNNGNRSVPTIIFPDGSKLVEPSSKELKKKIAAFFP
ncbi:MAG: mycoredoxin [Anaerolineaceae bacterium]|nr:mycoredoxin [Anaerolineaceae bacterium]